MAKIKTGLTGRRIIKASADISGLGALVQKLFILLLLSAAMAIAVKHSKETICHMHNHKFAPHLPKTK